MDVMKICCFTGHRDIAKKDTSVLCDRFDRVVTLLIERGTEIFRAGGALGFDTFAALRIIELKKKYPQLRLELFLPCHNQEKLWNDYEKKVYNYVLANADSIIYVSQSYSSGCMHKRNRALVDGADICVAYCNSVSGGTVYTVKYAKKVGVDVINLANMAEK